LGYSTAEMTRGLLPDPEVERIKAYILQHLDENITPKSIVEELGLPNSSTRHRFHYKTGISMPEYIRRQRREKEKQAAENEESTVT
jgi:AraC-like DNA-binding protein